jgi:hypothetical protein
MEKSLHVFVCSTYRDLVSERNAVLDGLEGLSDQFSALTFYCPRSIQPLDGAKEEIRGADVLVLILGNLQGVIAPGLDIPHGEAEYEEAIAQGKPVLVYLRDSKAGMYPSHFEREPARAAQLKNFREKLEKRHDAKIFDDIPSLVGLVTQDLYRMAQESGMKTKTGPKTTKFRARSWETRKLPVLAGAPAMQLLPEDMQTRTIPMLQKALSTPFQRRRSGRLPVGKTAIIGLIAFALIGFALTRLKVLPLQKLTQGSGAETRAAGQANPAVGAEPGSAAALPPQPALPPAPRKASGSVAVTDDEDSTKVFLRKALDGSREDQFQVGEMYEQGKDVPRNDSLAFKWYKRSAEKGYTEAQYKVALMYRIGKGTPKSLYQAARWFQAAADQGHAKAQFKLGQLYRAGKGVERNETTAFKWFLKAADQKDPDAEKMIAELKEN